MLSFAIYSNGKLAQKAELSGSHVVGTDDVPLRAEIGFKGGIISCNKRAAGPAGLALMWRVPGSGTLLLETVRVMERERPYVLTVELARGRLMRINHKLEDWGMLDYPAAEGIVKQVETARNTLIRALQANSDAEAFALGDEALSLAVQASEGLSQCHAELFLTRRKQASGFSRSVFGCAIPPEPPTDPLPKRLTDAFDFVTVPIVWRDIEPAEQAFNWKSLDAWVELLASQQVPMRAASLLSFSEKHIPDWLYIWEHDFDTIRDLAFEHVRRVINRYGQYIQTWDVISGIHANNCFTFNFEQLMELTRMTAALTKQVCPRGLAIIDLVAPWGEYYARNQRTIPPLLYADMAVQSGVNFDAFGLQFHFGAAVDGSYVRDMFQISALLDQFAKLGKPVHITALQVPSSVRSLKGESEPGSTDWTDGGVWRKPWSEQIQADFLARFVEVALSKPFVETISWHGLTDDTRHPVPNGGLLRLDQSPKEAYKLLVKTRSDLLGVSP